MKDLGNILESVADALSDSMASRTRRNAGAKRLIAPPPPGTPLLVSLALALEHTGVYLGDNKVAELQDDGFVKTVGEDEPDSKYAHAILLRYLVTLPEDDPVRKAYVARRSDWKDSTDGHPWEMIAFYRAMLCADKLSRIRYLKQAFALADQGGPTLQIIATVILGALLAEGDADAATYAAKVESVIAQLPALDAGRIAALRRQATNPQPGLLLAAKVLPFNFR